MEIKKSADGRIVITLPKELKKEIDTEIIRPIESIIGKVEFMSQRVHLAKGVYTEKLSYHYLNRQYIGKFHFENFLTHDFISSVIGNEYDFSAVHTLYPKGLKLDVGIHLYFEFSYQIKQLLKKDKEVIKIMNKVAKKNAQQREKMIELAEKILATV